MTVSTASEEQLVHIVRNALLVAGQEMGNGDHWPVVKDTVYKIMKDWEDLKVERNVDEELKVHLYKQLDEMDAGLAESSPEIQKEYGPKIKQLRESCDAYFTDIDRSAVEYDENDAPIHIKRMKEIIGKVEDEDA